MLQNLLLLSLLISLITVGIYAATWQKMIFHKPAGWLKKRLPAWICKPLFSCAICMSSVWTCIFWLFFQFDFRLIPFVVPAVAGLNTIIVSFISNIIPDEDE